MTGRRVMLMAAGTGGHVFPALAVATMLRQQGIDVMWLGTGKGIEARVVSQAEIPLQVIDIAGVRGKGVSTLLLAPLRILRSTLPDHFAVSTRLGPEADAARRPERKSRNPTRRLSRSSRHL